MELVILILINIFASQCLVFDEKNEPFHLKNALNLRHEFVLDNFNKKILLNFLLKIVI